MDEGNSGQDEQQRRIEAEKKRQVAAIVAFLKTCSPEEVERGFLEP